MKFTEVSIKNPILVLMVTCAAIFVGFTSLMKLKVDLFPKIKFPVLVVVTNYSGAAPKEVEEKITRPIEEAMAKVERIKRISSVMVEGSSFVILEFFWGTDMDLASLDVRDNLDSIAFRLPEEADDSLIQRQDFNARPIVWLTLTGEYSQDKLRDIAEDEFKNKIERIEGVGSVEIIGGLIREIQVRVDPQRLKAYNLTIQDVIGALKKENLNQRGGRLEEGKVDLLVRTIGRFEAVDEINDVIVTNFRGVSVFIKDLAEVKDTFKEKRDHSRLNRNSSVGLLVYKESDGNTVDVATKSIKRVEEIKKKLQSGIITSVVFDQSEYIRNSINMVKEAALNGSILAIIVLFLFLADWRSTLIISLAIPVSVISTFGLIYFKGMTLNLLTLAGLALGIGMVVDNSIVVLENIFRHLREGEGTGESSISGTKEVTLAVMASTLTTLAVFMPIAYVEGIAGEIFADLAFAVFFSLLFSLGVAFTIIPTLASRLLTKNKTELDPLRIKIYTSLAAGGLVGFFVAAYFAVNIGPLPYLIVVALVFAAYFYRLNIAQYTFRLYHWLISTLISRWYWKVAMIVSVIFLGYLSGLVKPGMEMFPKGKQKNAQIRVKLPVATSLKATNRTAKEVENYVLAYSEIKTAATNVQPDNFTITLNFPDEVADPRIDTILDELRAKLVNLPDAVARVKKVSGMHGGQDAADIEISIRGEELFVLKDLSEQVFSRIQKIEGILAPEISYKAGRPELQVQIDKKKAGDHNLSTREISDIVQASISGEKATKFQDGDEEYDILVQLRDVDKESREDIANLPVRGNLLLSDVAKLVWQRGPVKIERAEQKREVKVTANLQRGLALGDVMQQISNPQKSGVIDDITPPDGYTVGFGGQGRDMNEAFGELFKALGVAVVLIYMIMAAQFGSLVQPFLIMFTVPLSIIGVYFGLSLADLKISITAMIGVIMLAGIVVNNAILLIDYINIQRRKGVDRKQAIIKAGEVRLRPIMMTTLTTVLGMLPMALGIGAGVEFYRPLAVTVIGGLIFSTIISLVFIPILYDIVDEMILRLAHLSRRVFIGAAVSEQSSLKSTEIETEKVTSLQSPEPEPAPAD